MLMQGFPPPPEQRVTLTRPSGSRSRSGGGAADRTPDRWGRPGAGHGGGRAPLPVRQVRSDYVCRWSDLPRRRLVKGQQGSGLGVGEVAGARPLGSHVAPCGRQRAQAVAGRRPGVEEHQAVHEATGPASCGWGYGRPSRRRCSSVMGCAEGAATRHVGVFGFAGHGCFGFLVDFQGCRRHRSASQHVTSTVRPCCGSSRTSEGDGPHAPIDGQPQVSRRPARRGHVSWFIGVSESKAERTPSAGQTGEAVLRHPHRLAVPVPADGRRGARRTPPRGHAGHQRGEVGAGTLGGRVRTARRTGRRCRGTPRHLEIVLPRASGGHPGWRSRWSVRLPTLLSGAMGPVPRRRRTEGTVRAVEVAPASPHSTASGPQHACRADHLLRRSRSPGNRRRSRAHARPWPAALRRLDGGDQRRRHPPPPGVRTISVQPRNSGTTD
jgi:hypothetical protein